MSRLVVNARFLTQPITGVQRHAVEVSRRLRHMLPNVRFVTPGGVLHADLACELGAEQVGRTHGHLWEQAELPRYLDGAPLLSLCNAAPIALTRQIVTIHDAAPFSVPQAYSRPFRTWYRFMIRALGQRSSAIMTDSKFSADELMRRADIPTDKLTVVPLGCDHILATGRNQAVLDRHELRGRRYLLAVGSSSPHKNYAALLRVARHMSNQPFLFVIAGGTSARVHAIEDEVDANPGRSDSHIRHVGRVTDAELRTLYEHADGYVHPSYYEGFGLPPLEAMALGCPVMSARAGSLPEVLSDGALYFDPHDDADMAAAIARFMDDAVLRDRLRDRGLIRAAAHSWDRTAQEVLALVRATFG
ncbi:glycosyltransferase family 4 protein [Sphingomonas sp. HHU CXW]|uniref:Glycosyltransferase family 4 protein n=1 Tax=Sphingomonas hominis TaxID=2741495 RepID=A0ABX2JQU6_9SPHN|nr:glycosyltransferase family 1 protein [Sphingomonas hominis]NTS66797.1 glycosyltransferase family 4 protein [Sphingomonas hominis]